MSALRSNGLSKYTPIAEEPGVPSGYILVIDQTRGDASIPGGLASADTFRLMLAAAREENPGKRIVIRAHPDTRANEKKGHFTAAELRECETLLNRPLNPWTVIEGADRVYTVSSQMGFEAVMAGKPVTCFGVPFYSGWGLTEDRVTTPRRGVRRTVEQVFAASYFDYPIYYDPFDDCLCDFDDVLGVLNEIAPGLRSDTQSDGLILSGFRSWKRASSLRFSPYYPQKPKVIETLDKALDNAAKERRKLWIWASKAPEDALERARAGGVPADLVEDGFLRSVGLGAELVAPSSLVFDDCGIYYDPSRPSRLEALITEAGSWPADDPRLGRARRLIERIVAKGVTKYNTGGPSDVPASEGRPIILVPGQVEDDASIRLGTRDVRTNLGLLEHARSENPDAFLIYKPHPDVEAGLRPGTVPGEALRILADHVARSADPKMLMEKADALWTMTSLMGFEALLRGLPVHCLGIPFYAGWGLTVDFIPCPRRMARPGLEALVHAALITYPRYVDPVTGLPCSPERLVDRLASRVPAPRSGWATRLAKLQGWLAGQGLILWR